MLAGMQIQQSAMLSAQQRAAAMTGLPSRSAMPMGSRPTPTPGQMMGGNTVRPQIGGQQQPAAYTRTARNLPPNVSVQLKVNDEKQMILLFSFRIKVDLVIQSLLLVKIH
jgi:hypothetical protein